jgi:hypothetical protein
LKGSNATPGAEPEDEHGPLFGIPFSAEEEAIPEATEDADQRRRALEWVDPEGLDEYSGDEFETDPDFEGEAEVSYETETEKEPETDEVFEQPEKGQVTDPDNEWETEVYEEPETETEGETDPEVEVEEIAPGAERALVVSSGHPEDAGLPRGQGPDSGRGYDPATFFEDERNFEAYQKRAALFCRDEYGRLLPGLEDNHARMARGITEVIGEALVYPDYRISIEAAMWHCLRLVRVEGPSLAELADPGLGSGSRLYCATDVGLAACDDSRFRLGFVSPASPQRRSHSQRGEGSERESTWSGRSTGLLRGFQLVSEIKLKEIEDHL